MIAAIRKLWAEAMRPTIGSGYLWAVIGISHVMLGAALQGVLGASGAAARLVVAFGYWMLKERGDLRRGGSLRDGVVDAALVGVGAFYSALVADRGDRRDHCRGHHQGNTANDSEERNAVNAWGPKGGLTQDPNAVQS